MKLYIVSKDKYTKALRTGFTDFICGTCGEQDLVAARIALAPLAFATILFLVCDQVGDNIIADAVCLSESVAMIGTLAKLRRWT